MTLTLSRVRLTGALFTLVVAVLVGARVHAVSVRTVLPILPSDAIFNDTVVHEIRLDINAKDWQTLRDNYLTNEYYPCDFRWNGQVVRNVGIRSRGQASRSATKPSLRVDFNRYTASQTLLDLKSVVLRNNATDFSSMHERVSMLLYARMGLPAPRVAHARLYINNTYQGLYSIVESLDKSFLSRNFDQNDGYLYKYRPPADGSAVLPRLSGAERQFVLASSIQPGDARRQPEAAADRRFDSHRARRYRRLVPHGDRPVPRREPVHPQHRRDRLHG